MDATDHERAVGAFIERMMQAALGAVDVLSVALGDRLGWYRALVEHGPSTASELAERTGTAPRYAREWLEQQTATGMVELIPAEDGTPEGRRFSLPPAVAEVLTDPDSVVYFAPLARMFVAVGPHLPALLDAYRSGGGVSWAELGAEARESQAAMNRPLFAVLPTALAAAPEIDARLRAPGARLADVGCGAGWSSIALARAIPTLRVDGVDIDEPSIAMAREHAREAGVDDRVRFHAADAAGLDALGTFDVAFAFECLHDMPHPVDVLAAMHRAVRPEGAVVIVDEAVGDELVADADFVDRLMYGFSLLVCLPDGLSHPSSEGTGTVMRPATLRGYAQRAGFADLRVLPIEEFGLLRFYELTR